MGVHLALCCTKPHMSHTTYSAGDQRRQESRYDIQVCFSSNVIPSPDSAPRQLFRPCIIMRGSVYFYSSSASRLTNEKTARFDCLRSLTTAQKSEFDYGKKHVRMLSVTFKETSKEGDLTVCCLSARPKNKSSIPAQGM